MNSWHYGFVHEHGEWLLCEVYTTGGRYRWCEVLIGGHDSPEALCQSLVMLAQLDCNAPEYEPYWLDENTRTLKLFEGEQND